MSDDVPPRPDRLSVPGELPPRSRGGGVAALPTATWSWWQAIGVYVAAFLIGGFAALPVLRFLRDDDDLATLAASAVAALVVVAVLLVWLGGAHPRWREIVGFPAPGRWWREIRASIGFGLLLYPAMVFVIGLILTVALETVSGNAVRAPEQVPRDLSAAGIAIAVVYAIVIAPIHEELFFRGILFRGVRDRYGLVPGLLATGVGFALIHYTDAPWQNAVLLMGVMLFNGMALGWWYERRGTIVAPIVVHMMFNVIGLTLILALR
jgi:membrane protease YdiL (CAAX protease family)